LVVAPALLAERAEAQIRVGPEIGVADDHGFALRAGGTAAPGLDRSLLDALLKAGKLGNTLGNLVEASRFLDQAVALAVETGAEEEEKLARVDRAWALMYENSFYDAIVYLKDILARLDPESDQAHIFMALSGLAQAEMNHGMLVEAEQHYLQAIELAESLGDDRMLSTVVGNIGLVYWKMGQIERALSSYERALALDQARGDLIAITRHTGNIGILYMERGRYQEALETIGDSLEAAVEMGSKRSIAMRTGNMGIVYGLLGQYEHAHHRFELALRMDREAGYRLGEGLWHGNIADVLRSEGRHAEALGHYETAESILRGVSATYNLPWVLIGKAEVQLLLGDLGEAESAREETARVAEQVGRREKVFAAGVLEARIKAAGGDAQAGRALLQSLFDEGISESEEAELHYELWRMGAREHRGRALALYERVADADPQVRNLVRRDELAQPGNAPRENPYANEP
jgi:tetratricopeptide (TPR) repeat protein